MSVFARVCKCVHVDTYVCVALIFAVTEIFG